MEIADNRTSAVCTKVHDAQDAGGQGCALAERHLKAASLFGKGGNAEISAECFKMYPRRKVMPAVRKSKQWRQLHPNIFHACQGHQVRAAWRFSDVPRPHQQRWRNGGPWLTEPSWPVGVSEISAKCLAAVYFIREP